MRRVYKEKNVYDASQDRLKYVFDNFERVYLSFSGGKDSSLALHYALRSTDVKCLVSVFSENPEK